jgi:hypothetical protein
LGISFNLLSHFLSTFSDISSVSPHLLTSGNNSTVSKYIDYVTDQVIHHKLDTKIDQLLSKLHNSPNTLSIEDCAELDTIDSMLSDIMLAGERHSSSALNAFNVNIGLLSSVRSPALSLTMETKKLFNWPHLERLRTHTFIYDTEHSIIDPIFIHKKREARNN